MSLSFDADLADLIVRGDVAPHVLEPHYHAIVARAREGSITDRRGALAVVKALATRGYATRAATDTLLDVAVHAGQPETLRDVPELQWVCHDALRALCEVPLSMLPPVARMDVACLAESAVPRIREAAHAYTLARTPIMRPGLPVPAFPDISYPASGQPLRATDPQALYDALCAELTALECDATFFNWEICIVACHKACFVEGVLRVWVDRAGVPYFEVRSMGGNRIHWAERVQAGIWHLLSTEAVPEGIRVFEDDANWDPTENGFLDRLLEVGASDPRGVLEPLLHALACEGILERAGDAIGAVACAALRVSAFDDDRLRAVAVLEKLARARRRLTPEAVDRLAALLAEPHTMPGLTLKWRAALVAGHLCEEQRERLRGVCELPGYCPRLRAALESI